MSEEGFSELEHELRAGKSLDGKRVRAAPTFSLRVGDASTTFSGAQDAESWLSMFEQCADLAGAR